MSEVDDLIERIKNTTTAIADLLADIDKQRDIEIKDICKRISRLEYKVYNKKEPVEPLNNA